MWINVVFQLWIQKMYMWCHLHKGNNLYKPFSTTTELSSVGRSTHQLQLPIHESCNCQYYRMSVGCGRPGPATGRMMNRSVGLLKQTLNATDRKSSSSSSCWGCCNCELGWRQHSRPSAHVQYEYRVPVAYTVNTEHGVQYESSRVESAECYVSMWKRPSRCSQLAREQRSDKTLIQTTNH